MTSFSEMPYVHVGVLVEDLDDSIERYSRLGYTFMDPLSVHVDRLVENGRETELDLRIVFAHQGPPHFELLQATGDGIYGRQHAGGLHHLAVLDEDPARRRDELVARGFRETAAQYRNDGSMIVSYLDPADLDGVRIELLDAPVNDAILRWIAGDETARP
jgi:catechol 2,3-dioxygenase-like lactoylglutathione lyase family enzyme